jgi:hypothetical protein
MKLNGKHLRTLHAIFEEPVRSDVKWIDRSKAMTHEGDTGHVEYAMRQEFFSLRTCRAGLRKA